MGPVEWAMLIALSLLWGGAFFFARIAVQEVPPFTTVLVRVGLAAITLTMIIALTRQHFSASGSLWRQFAMMGLLNNVIPFSLLFYGQTEIGAGLASIINGLTPIWTAIIAHFATKDERLTPLKSIGVVAGFFGVAVLIGGSASGGLGTSTLAQLAVVGTACAYGFASVYGRRFKAVPPIQTARGQLTMSTLFMIPIVLVIDQPWTLSWPGSDTIWALVLLAIVCTALAYILFFAVLQRAGALNIALVTFLIPPSAIALGILFLGETLELNHLIGLGLIMAGLLAIDGRLFQRK